MCLYSNICFISFTAPTVHSEFSTTLNLYFSCFTKTANNLQRSCFIPDLNTCIMQNIFIEIAENLEVLFSVSCSYKIQYKTQTLYVCCAVFKKMNKNRLAFGRKQTSPTLHLVPWQPTTPDHSSPHLL